MEASKSLIRPVWCPNPKCGSDLDGIVGAPCPDCGTALKHHFGRCSDCDVETDRPEIEQCGPCAGFDSYADSTPFVDTEVDF